jgi:heme-degrading monooxygenase HmoA
MVMFRHLVRVATRIDGFVLARRVVPESRSLVLISLWRSDEDMIRYTGLDEHVNASRWSLKVGAEVWSAVFDVRGGSSMSRGWIGDLQPWISEELERQPT